MHGVVVGEVDAAARQQFNLPTSLKGALVANIDADSAAFAAGLRQGDVIQEINRKPIHNGLSRVLLGSTAERVVRHAPCPVLIMRRH